MTKTKIKKLIYEVIKEELNEQVSLEKIDLVDNFDDARDALYKLLHDELLQKDDDLQAIKKEIFTLKHRLDFIYKDFINHFYPERSD